MLVPLKKIMNKCNVMMFAAGIGARLRPATNQHPKPVIPMNQIALGYYTLPYLDAIKIDQFIVNTFYLPEQIHTLYQSVSTSIIFSNETDFIKGSAGGLVQAKKYFNMKVPILAMNADEVFFTAENNFIQNALDKHYAENAQATLIVTEHPEAGHKFNAIWCEDETVVHIGKDRPSPTAKPWHYIGLQFLSPELLQNISENSELNIFYDVLIYQLKNIKVQIYSIECDWYEVGNIVDYTKAKSEISKQLEINSVYISHFEKLKKLPCSQLSDLA